MSVARKVTAGVIASGLAAAGLVGAASSASASTVVGQEFEDNNYNGSILTIAVRTDGFTCTAATDTVDVTFANMPDGWNDTISSFTGFSGCWTKIYEDAAFQGASLPYRGERTYVGDAMNDQTSSMTFS